MLGHLEVRCGERPVELSSERLRSLVGVLAMSARSPVAAEVVGRRIWGEPGPENARRSVQTLVARLRGALGAAAVDTSPGGYRLLVTPERVDALRFGALLDAASRSAGTADERRLLDEALALWRGSPFEGISSDWLLQSLAPLLIERYLGAVERRIDLDIAAGRFHGLVAELRELTARYPVREPLWVRLLDVLERDGRPAEALAAYETVRRRLAAELGAEPGADLRSVHGRLLAADAAAARPAPAPSRLPADVADFTGRTAALAALDALLPDPTAPPGGPIVIAAIEGAGGIGKTALALHWAHRVRDRFADGHLYVNLRGYGPGDPLDPAAALDQLLREAGLPAEEIPAGLEARSALLRSRLASRRVLLVLDNARDVAQVRPLLPGSTGMVVVTSRDQMRGLVARERARRIDLDVLSPGEAVTLLTRLLPGRRDSAECLAELARLCGYSPLALTLAAEQARRDTGAGVEEGVEEGLEDLIGRITAEHHRLAAFDTGDGASGGVRAVFAWSYQALDDEAARLFRLLGLQPGPDLGVPAAAALAGIGTGPAGRSLQRLAETNLAEERRPGRFELHDLLRSYAAELVDRVDDGATRGAAIDRLLGFYVHSANAARAAVNPGRGLIETDPPPDGVEPLDFGADAERALAWFDTERFTLASAVRYAIGAARHRAAAELTRMVWELLITGHQLGGWEDLQRAATASARQAGDVSLEGVLSNQLGITLMDQNRYDEAIVGFERALTLFGRAGDERGRAMALTNLGLVLRMDGRLEESRDALRSALDYFERERLSESGPANNLALTYVAMGRHDEALPLALRAVEIDRTTGARIQLAGALDTLGQVYAGQGKHGDAVATYHEALSLEQGLSDQKVVGMLVHLGASYRDSGHPARAAETWRSALRTIDEQGFADGIHLRRSEVVRLLATVEPREG